MDIYFLATYTPSWAQIALLHIACAHYEILVLKL